MRDARLRVYMASIVALLAWNDSVRAQVMIDPTRPPRSVTAPEGANEHARGAVLQSVMITPNRRSAIIDGERVELGGRYRDAQVVRITESEVVLREGERTEILKMYPDVEKKAVKSHVPAQAKAPPARSRP